MKKTIKLAVVAALALGATSAFATNGSNLIATGAKARGMGGTSIGISHGAESGLSNPALITSVKGTEISFGGTIFMPDVTNTSNLGAGAETANSAADLSVIPEVSIVSKINDNFYMGLGMWGTAGMGVDYRDSIDQVGTGTGTQMEMVTNLQLMQFGVPMAYKMGSFSIAITPVLQYGSLDINYVAPTGPGTTADIGAGVAQDLQFGYNLGLSYDIDNVTIGAIYKSQIDMEYKGSLSTAVAGMVPTYTNDKLSTPEEIGIGISYSMQEHTIAIDYKNIKWSDAEGYKDFQWEDQDVYALGYEYATKTWALRAGYNYAKSPIKEQTDGITNSAGLNDGIVNTFNLLGFPGIVEKHYTFGGTYNISDKTSVDMAYVFAPEVTKTFTNFMNEDMTVKHSQSGLSLAVNYNF